MFTKSKLIATLSAIAIAASIPAAYASADHGKDSRDRGSHSDRHSNEKLDKLSIDKHRDAKDSKHVENSTDNSGMPDTSSDSSTDSAGNSLN